MGRYEEVGPSLGLASKGTGPSFAEVLRSDSVSVAKELHIVGGHHSGMRVSLEKPCALNLLPAVRFVEEDPRSVVDCSLLPRDTGRLSERVRDREIERRTEKERDPILLLSFLFSSSFFLLLSRFSFFPFSNTQRERKSERVR